MVHCLGRKKINEFYWFCFSQIIHHKISQLIINVDRLFDSFGRNNGCFVVKYFLDFIAIFANEVLIIIIRLVVLLHIFR
jgi:hypothetical protein